MPVPNQFANVTTSIPLSQLDANFNTPITLGNTAIQLGNTVTTLNNMTLANATVSSGNVTVTSASLSGNLTFTGTGNRITGDMSNATVTNRLFFQNSVTNGNSQILMMPNGTGTSSSFIGYNSSDPTNASLGTLQVIGSTDVRIQSTISGTGTYLPMTFFTGGSERMRIDTSGNVGIGGAPSYRLDVQGGTASFTGSSGVGAIRVAGAAGSFFWIDNPTATTMRFSSGATPGTGVMVLDNAGNVGIGTTGPNAKLHVQGTFRATDNVSLYSTGSAIRGINFGSNEIAWAQATTTTFLNLCDASGSNGANYNLTIRGLASAGAASATLAFVTIDSSIFSCLGVYTSTVGATNRDVFVDNTGKIGYVSSLRRTKTNIENLTDTSWLHQLNPVTFNYRKKDEEGGYTDEVDGDIQYGLIAEDVEQVRPDLCFYDEADGEQELRGIQYSKLVPVMLKAIQELKAELDALKGVKK